MTQYFESNRRWITPLVVGLMLALGPILLQVIGGPDASPLPAWVPSVGLMVAAFGAAIGAMRTDTTSAYLVRSVGFGVSLVVVFYSIFK